ncbi:hypothetical protein ES703_08490 [subsurface metagenome]
MKVKVYFTDDEIQCKCGCGKLIKRDLHFTRMNLLRQAMGRALRVNSWCRCLKHNRKARAKDTSSHLEGFATDIKARTFLMKIKLVFYAGKYGFHGIGWAKTFIHLDNDPIKGPNRFWTY